jgi:hypothetical protein
MKYVYELSCWPVSEGEESRWYYSSLPSAEQIKERLFNHRFPCSDGIVADLLETGYTDKTHHLVAITKIQVLKGKHDPSSPMPCV